MNRFTGANLPFISFWPVLLLVGFASAIFLPAVVVGYRWTVEFSIAVFLLLALSTRLFKGLTQRQLPQKEKLLVLYPLLLFTLWSFASIAWAESYRGALHHSLLWTCYLIFYVLVRFEIRSKDQQTTSMVLVLAVVFAISLACVVEYIGDVRPLTMDFTTRYYSYAEISAMFLPIVLAVAIGENGRQSMIAFGAFTVTWAMIVATTSRTMFISAIAGICVYLLIGSLMRRKLESPIKWLAAGAILVSVFLISQSSFLQTSSVSLSERFSGREESSNLSARSRILFWGLAIEGFRTSPVVGIGADNYFADYRLLRERYSARNPDSQVLEINEDIIPERAHNEYLEILCELGIIGALLFGWLLCGIVYMIYQAVTRKASPTAVGAIAGIVAFFVASTTSSYSFRYPANGISFIFLLAIASREIFEPHHLEAIGVSTSMRRKLLPFIGITSVIAMLVFSLTRGISFRHLVNSQNTEDRSFARSEIEKAISIDPSEPMFRYYYGENLYLAGELDAAVPQMRIAIDNGASTSTAYFDLAAILMRLERYGQAKIVFDEALRVYPRSVFIHTAYASFLKRTGQPEQGEREFDIAVGVNEKQARSWQMAHDEGLEKLVQRSRTDNTFLSPFDLLPASAPLALANFQKTTTR